MRVLSWELKQEQKSHKDLCSTSEQWVVQRLVFSHCQFYHTQYSLGLPIWEECIVFVLEWVLKSLQMVTIKANTINIILKKALSCQKDQ